MKTRSSESPAGKQTERCSSEARLEAGGLPARATEGRPEEGGDLRIGSDRIGSPSSEAEAASYGSAFGSAPPGGFHYMTQEFHAAATHWRSSQAHPG